MWGSSFNMLALTVGRYRGKRMKWNSTRKTNTALNSQPSMESVNSAKSLSTETRLSQSTSERVSQTDGALAIILGLKGSGKTSFALDHLPQGFVIIAPGATNPDVLDLDYVYNDDRGIRYAVERRNHVVFTYKKNDNLFSYLLKPGLVLLLDDVRMILTSTQLRREFEEWIRGIRWRHQRVIITTHRPVGDMEPIAYDMASRIFWVGSLRDKDEADLLWKHRDQDWEKPEYYLKLKTLKKYDYLRRNTGESVLMIKSD